MANYTSKYTGQQIDDLLDSITLDGRTFVIKDIFPTLESLETAYPTGNEYAYQVEADRNIYLWSENNNAWESLGQIEGPQGPAGEPGQDGTDGKSAYQSAVDGGFGGTEEDFNEILATTQLQINEANNRIYNPTLLDNGDFANPVNQRGQSSYSGAGYTIDRWTIVNSGVSLNVNNGNIYLSGNVLEPFILQIIENPQQYQGLTLTASIYVLGVDNGQIGRVAMFAFDGTEYHTATSPNITSGYTHCTITVPPTCTQLFIRLYTNPNTTGGVYFTKSKLEVGTKSTLPNNPPQDYGTELAKCQRYQLEVSTGVQAVLYRLISAKLSFYYPIPISMRSGGNPTFTGTFTIVKQDGTIFSDFSYAYFLKPNGIIVEATKTAHGLTIADTPILSCSVPGVFDRNL